jgi:hypothetical protein
VLKLMLKQCHIMMTIRKHVYCAFETLGAIVNQLLSKVDIDGMEVPNEFIQSNFNPDATNASKRCETG